MRACVCVWSMATTTPHPHPIPLRRQDRDNNIRAAAEVRQMGVMDREKGRDRMGFEDMERHGAAAVMEGAV